MGHFKVSKSSGALGMDHPLRNPLPDEVGHVVEEHMVLEEQWAPGTDDQGVQEVGDRSSVARGQPPSVLGGLSWKILQPTYLMLLLVIHQLVCRLVSSTHRCWL